MNYQVNSLLRYTTNPEYNFRGMLDQKEIHDLCKRKLNN